MIIKFILILLSVQIIHFQDENHKRNERSKKTIDFLIEHITKK